jgi:hypothetical protein
MPGSNRRVVAEANDLNPRNVRVFRCTGADFHDDDETLPLPG